MHDFLPLYDRETWWKTGVKFDADGREVSYDLVKGFQFLADQSAVSPDSRVTVANIPAVSGAARMRDADQITSWAFQVGVRDTCIVDFPIAKR